MKKWPACTEAKLARAFHRARRDMGSDVTQTCSKAHVGTVQFKDGRMAQVFVKVIRFDPVALQAMPETGGLLEML